MHNNGGDQVQGSPSSIMGQVGVRDPRARVAGTLVVGHMHFAGGRRRSSRCSFPAMSPSYCIQLHSNMSQRSVQKVASDVGMAIDAQRMVAGKPLLTTITAKEAYVKEKVPVNVDSEELFPELKNSNMNFSAKQNYQNNDCFWREGERLTISVEDYMY